MGRDRRTFLIEIFEGIIGGPMTWQTLSSRQARVNAIQGDLNAAGDDDSPGSYGMPPNSW